MLTALLFRLRRIGAWLLKHPMAALAAIGAIVLLVLRRQRDSARGQRDREHRRADEAEADAAVVTETMEAREAGQALAEEIRDVPITGDPDADRDALYDRVRDIARREEAISAVRDVGAAGAPRDDDAGHRRRDPVSPGTTRGGMGRVAELPRPGLAAPDVTAGEAFEGSEMIEELK